MFSSPTSGVLGEEMQESRHTASGSMGHIFKACDSTYSTCFSTPGKSEKGKK